MNLILVYSYMFWNIWRIKQSFPDLTGPSSQETSSSKTIKNSCGAKDTTQALSGAESTCGKEVFALAITLTCNYWKKKKRTQNSSRSDQDKEEFMRKVQISHIISHLWNDIECSLNNRYKIIGIKRLIVLH